jgi:hypothetical protein
MLFNFHCFFFFSSLSSLFHLWCLADIGKKEKNVNFVSLLVLFVVPLFTFLYDIKYVGLVVGAAADDDDDKPSKYRS